VVAQRRFPCLDTADKASTLTTKTFSLSVCHVTGNAAGNVTHLNNATASLCASEYGAPDVRVHCTARLFLRPDITARRRTARACHRACEAAQKGSGYSYLDRSITATANEETLIPAINFVIARQKAKPQHRNR
jgi:hypothetical protein